MVLELENEAARDALVDRLSPLVQQAAAKGKGPAVGRSGALVQPDGHLSDLKRKLLEGDRDLQDTWQQLVGAGILTDAEFWRGHQDLLQGAPAASRQRTGFSTAMIGDVRQGSEGSTDRVTFKITKDTVQQIFSEKPHIKLAYQLRVPHTLDEKTFWQRYLKYLARCKARQKKAGAAEHDDDEDEAIFGEDRAASNAEMRKRIKHVDPSVNIAADQFESFETGYGTAHSGRQDPKSSGQGIGAAEAMFRDLNRHAAAVVEGMPEMDAGGQAESVESDAIWRARMSSSLDDLRSAGAEAFAPLQIKDPRRYFSSQTGLKDQMPAGSNRGVQHSQTDVTDRLQAVFNEPVPALESFHTHQILLELTQDASSLDDEDGRSNTAPKIPHVEPQHLAVLRPLVLTCNELLRHFWACLGDPMRQGDVSAAGESTP
ncbi:hypothetical protein WJX84_000774 [Apatococcus fuscideae]|uniref:BSD domain-containing protein n=1 Tax=Apatococcus fuscideae TaxID=2026836 RepID=A0AAW1TFD9_9CHLO